LKCLDTDLLIAILRGKQEAYNISVEIEQEAKAATTTINAFEIFYGAYKSQMKNQNIKETDKLLDKLEVIPLERLSAKKAAEISEKLAEKGQQIDYRDAMIAAVAIQNDLTLVTRNKAHFNRIKDLKLQTW
jgi:tRNA(fMet)-specific endonuclease VapC